MSQGRRWSYDVQDPYGRRVIEVSVSGETRVGLGDGYLLTSRDGVSKLGWQDGRLIAEEILGQRFDPPIILLVPAKQATTWSYIGTVSAEAAQAPSSYELDGQTIDTLRVEFVIDGGASRLVTHFAKGTGIVDQAIFEGERRKLHLALVAAN